MAEAQREGAASLMASVTQTAIPRAAGVDSRVRHTRTTRTCNRCGCRDLGAPSPGWARGKGGLLCLSCRREIVVERAVAGLDSKVAKVDAKRRALLRFELTRDQDRKLSEIAKPAGAPLSLARLVRDEMRAAGELRERRPEPTPSAKRRSKPRRQRQPQAPKRKRGKQTVRPLTLRERWPKMAATIEHDPRRSNAGIAQEFGVTPPTVRRVRLELEGTGRIERFRADPWTERRRRAA